MNLNYPCKCGHPFSFHMQGRGGSFAHCIDKDNKLGHYCEWHPDNLKYLEMKYEESLKNG